MGELVQRAADADALLTTSPRLSRCCVAIPKRALVIIVTNFRDEDSSELRHALRLLRSRHLVLLASLKEKVVRELITQPLGFRRRRARRRQRAPLRTIAA